MSTTPWFPHEPVWSWRGISERFKARAKERYQERTEIIIRTQAPGVAELRAYCELIGVMHAARVFGSDHLRDDDVIRQLRIAENFARHDAIGRRIMAGTWPKRAPGADKSVLTEEDLI